jgi:hypothetical protein
MISYIHSDLTGPLYSAVIDMCNISFSYFALEMNIDHQQAGCQVRKKIAGRALK